VGGLGEFPGMGIIQRLPGRLDRSRRRLKKDLYQLRDDITHAGFDKRLEIRHAWIPFRVHGASFRHCFNRICRPTI
jgi:hypothetical protein